MTYHSKIIAGGKVVIPVALRREFGFADGDTVVFEREGGTLVLKSRQQVLREIQAKVKAAIKEPFTVDEFIADRRAEAARE
jgi:AbrB family transcriptional regulator, stage V sporulation protein T